LVAEGTDMGKVAGMGKEGDRSWEMDEQMVEEWYR
jgi:hypothetical protein